MIQVLVKNLRDITRTSWHDEMDAADVIEQLYECIDTLTNLVDWAREHTSPRDENSPHDILVAAVNALNKLPRR